MHSEKYQLGQELHRYIAEPPKVKLKSCTVQDRVQKNHQQSQMKSRLNMKLVCIHLSRFLYYHFLNKYIGYIYK